jgi:ribonuclease HI
MLPFMFFLGEHIRLYREAQLAYIISDEANPTNHPIFALDIYLGSILLQLTDVPKSPLGIRKQSLNPYEYFPLINFVWKMFFDGASSREGVGVGVVFVSPIQEIISLSYNLEFETTNNVAEYEALVLGLRAIKYMGIEEISVFGDAKLIIHKIRNIYQAKNPRLKSYRNEVWDLVDGFFLDFNISFVPREENAMVDSLVVSTSNFRVPLPPNLRYDVEVKYRPSIPDNVKHWKVFKDDLEIKIFLETIDEFSAIHIDQDPDSKIDLHDDAFLNKIYNHNIVQLPSNHIPKELVPLESLFDRNDVAIKGKISNENVDVEGCDIGIEKEPKFVKLSSTLSREQKVEYAELLK